MTATVLAPAPFMPEHAPRRGLALVDRIDGTTSREIRVVIAHGQALLRAGIRSLLEGGQGISVVAEAAGCDEAIALARRLGPDVVLMDAKLPELEVEGIRQIAALAGVRVMMLTATDSDKHVFQALRAGATAFLVQDTEPAELVRAVRLVARGEALLSPSLTRRLIAELVSRPEVRQPGTDELLDLTARDRAQLVVLTYQSGLVRAGTPVAIT